MSAFYIAFIIAQEITQKFHKATLRLGILERVPVILSEGVAAVELRSSTEHCEVESQGHSEGYFCEQKVTVLTSPAKDSSLHCVPFENDGGHETLRSVRKHTFLFFTFLF